MKIEKGIPIPAQGQRNTKYPLAQLEVGDSIAVESKLANTMRSTFYRYRVDHPGFAFVSRSITENDAEVIRFWRTA